MLKGKAESLEEDDSHNIWQDVKAPTVIRLRQFIRVPYRDIPLSRKNIFQRDNNCCQYCGQKNKKLSIDHVIPRSRGGKDNWENVITACLHCNVKKGNRTPEEAKMPLIKKPFIPKWNIHVLLRDKKIPQEWEDYI